MSKDDLLDQPLLTDDDIKSFVTEVRAMQAGSSQSIVGSDFWSLAMAELQRRQINLQTKIAKSLTRATWTLAILTVVIAAATMFAAIFAR
ncbi:MAG: hypothetical protein WCE23_15840 [Candidatus Binatus sp.]|uniref:hypothetical protein n=1 Tax=Candidatus Binatus sp. TaxID=2811406 RepID=UPI003C747DD6